MKEYSNLKMKNLPFLIILILLVFVKTIYGQSSFKKLSRPEKCWVIGHPFKAKKAQIVTKGVQLVVDSLKKSGIIGIDNLGGKLDAFKHAYWMASLSMEIGSRRALKLGKAHEKGNYLQFKKRLLEDAALPDSVSSEMDLRNNSSGVYLAGYCRSLDKKTVQHKVLKALDKGELSIIKKDEQGNYLDCAGVIIPMKEWVGKWGIPKCLIPSNQY